MPKHYHVTPRPSGFAVIGVGAKRASSVHETQGAAIIAARPLAQQAGGELRIHRPNGQIRESWSYGPDPCPPQG